MKVVERGQAVHEYALGSCLTHDFPRNTVGNQILNSFFPNGIRLSHGNPDVRIDRVGTGNRRNVFREFQRGVGIGCDGPAVGDQFFIRPVFLWGAGNKVHAHLRAADHQ